MMGQRELPNVSDLVSFDLAVAGHEGTLCDLDGSLFIKPCTQKEINFYDTANAEHEAFAQIMPTCYGALKLMGATDAKSLDAQLPIFADQLPPEIKGQVVKAAQEMRQSSESSHGPEKKEVPWAPNQNKKLRTDVAIALDNAAYGFKKPNILDCKLGVRLWADDAPVEKRERFEKITASTTHKNLGFRIAGMRVYRGAEDPQELNEHEYKIYDKDYGRFSVDDGNVLDTFRRFIFNTKAGVDDEVGRLVAGAFLRDLQYVQQVLENEESRMYSSSLLFVFEGDGKELQAAVDEIRASEEALALRRKEKLIESVGRSASRVDSGIAMDHNGELIRPVDEDDGDEGDDDEGDDDDELFSADMPRVVHTLNLIDFAHAEWTPGKGPDENALTGVRSLVKIFEELAREPEDQ